MRKFIYLSIVFFTLLSFTNKDKNLKITYLANCGYLYQYNRAKVLIDPFGTQYGNFFFLPSDETKKNIVKGNDPFNHIDLFLITHIHGDHFNARLTENFLLNNSRAKMICPMQVYQQMKDSCVAFSDIESRIICPGLAMNKSKRIKINGIPVTAIRMQHGTNRSLEGISYADYTNYEKTENYGYLIHFNSKTIFHQGDGCLKINSEALQNIDCHPDFAYLSYFDWDSISLDILKKKLGAQNVIFMHGTKPGKEKETEEFGKISADLLFFDKELESKSFK